MNLRAGKYAVCSMFLLASLIGIVGCATMEMPGKSFSGPQPAYTKTEEETEVNLQRHVDAISGIGVHALSVSPENLEKAARYVEEQFAEIGYQTTAYPYGIDGHTVRNIEAVLPGTGKMHDVIIVGAHYDSERNTPGANDNATGVAATLEIARLLKGKPGLRTIRFVAFVNEELPYFHSKDMGSIRYAKGCRARGDEIKVALCMDMIGHFSQLPDTNEYLWPYKSSLPSTADFIMFSGRNEDTDIIKQCVGFYRSAVPFPCEGGAVPSWYPGVWTSDHAAFWRSNYPGIHILSVADYPYYHKPGDTPDKIEFPEMARVTVGMARLVGYLADLPEGK